LTYDGLALVIYKWENVEARHLHEKRMFFAEVLHDWEVLKDGEHFPQGLDVLYVHHK